MATEQKTEAQMSAAEKKDLITAALEEKKVLDPEIIDIHEMSPIADYFVIGTAGNKSQMDALVEAVDECMHKNGEDCKKAEGTYGSGWMLIDCGDVIVHIFSQEAREFYDLDRIWKEMR